MKILLVSRYKEQFVQNMLPFVLEQGESLHATMWKESGIRSVAELIGKAIVFLAHLRTKTDRRCRTEEVADKLIEIYNSVIK